MTRYLLQISIAIGVLIALYMLTPLLDLLEMFFYICLVPLMFFVAMGLVTEGTIQVAWEVFSTNTFGKLREKIQAYRAQMASDDAVVEGFAPGT